MAVGRAVPRRRVHGARQQRGETEEESEEEGKWREAVSAGQGGVLSHTWLSPGGQRGGQGAGGQVVATVAMSGDVRGACEGDACFRRGWAGQQGRWGGLCPWAALRAFPFSAFIQGSHCTKIFIVLAPEFTKMCHWP